MSNKQLIGPANRAFTSNGFPAPGATVSLYLSGTLTPANFYADDGLVTSLGPTLTANGAGRFETPAYQDEFTAFRIIYRDALGVQLDDIDPFFFGYEGPRGPQGIQGDVSKVLTRTALAAIAVGGQAYGLVRYLVESGYEGAFIWNPADLSANVADDPGQFDYVPPGSGQGLATDGTDGAWVRANVVSIKTRAQLAAMPKSGVFLFDGSEWTFDTSDLSAKVTADTTQAVYVAPSSDTTGGSGAWVRTVFGPISVKWFGATGNGATDDTAAIQAAVDYVFGLGGGKVYLPRGTYLVSEVTTPLLAQTETIRTIELCGEAQASATFGTIGTLTMDEIGSVIKSSGTGGGVIRAADYAGSYSNVHLVVRNLLVRTYDNPNKHGIHAQWAQQLSIYNSVIDTGVYSVQCAHPTNNNIYGVFCPESGNGALLRFENVSISGYWAGVYATEHFHADALQITACYIGLDFRNGYHSCHFGRATIQRCTYPIAFDGTCYVYGHVNIEHANSALGIANGGIDVPGDTSTGNGWQVTVADIIDVFGGGHGYITWNVVLGGVGNDDTFTVSGTTNIRTRQIHNIDSAKLGIFLRSTNLAVPTGGWLAIPLDTADRALADVTWAASPNPDRVTVSSPGDYRVLATGAFAANGTGHRGLRLIRNGATIGVVSNPANSSDDTHLQVTGYFPNMVAGDWIMAQAYQDSGGDLDLDTTGAFIALYVEKIGEPFV